MKVIFPPLFFRSGVLNRYNTFCFDPLSEFVETPDRKQDPVYNRDVFERKLNEMLAGNEVTRAYYELSDRRIYL